MELKDFLKLAQVQCVSKDCPNLTAGKTYEVLGVTRSGIKIIDDENKEWWYPISCFEPVIDSAEKPLQGVELTPKFKVGDKVYVGLTGRIAQVTEIIDDDVVSVANKNNEVRAWVSNICHATQENYERLQATFPDIEFEQPTKELTGSDLARAMLDKGWNLVPCVISQISDDEALLNDDVVFIDEWNGRQFEHGDKFCIFAVPFDPKTGELLTEAVLDE